MGTLGSRDTRTKRQKLEAMANQTASPREAEIARRMLREMGATTEPSADVSADIRAFMHRMSWDDLSSLFDDLMRGAPMPSMSYNDIRRAAGMDQPMGRRTGKDFDAADQPGRYYAKFLNGDRCPHCGHRGTMHPAMPEGSWHYQCIDIEGPYACVCELLWAPGKR